MPDLDAFRPTPVPARRDDEGGDAACWLAQVCPDCGALNEDPTAVCWRCGAGPAQDGPARAND